MAMVSVALVFAITCYRHVQLSPGSGTGGGLARLHITFLVFLAHPCKRLATTCVFCSTSNGMPHCTAQLKR